MTISQDLARVVTWPDGRGLLAVCRPYHTLSGQTTSKCWFLLEICRVKRDCSYLPTGTLRRSSSQKFSRANLREDFVGAELCASGERHHFFPVGTFCFNSSNQFSTTLICVGAACACSLGLSIRKRWPSGDTS